ncbi:regulator of G-protein signaling 20-like isoform X2 [Acipenser ruthenus]|uniref:regulator of G-protein signaling 20-like isoform X2 n=1 Tax=Acipenser ruthenus TaxID=7906 RepID=UPI00145A1441|nr:regulator of G-protein signaling 20-like isoform X2 [Acipenser ruthenus]
MGSERMEMRKRQMSVQQETGSTAQAQPDTGSTAQAQPDTGSTAQAQPDTGSTAQAQPDTGSTAQAQPDTGSTAQAQPDTGSTAQAQPDTGSTAQAQPDTGSTAQAQQDTGNRGSNACCFCWCCCCSCSWNEDEDERPARASHDVRAEGTPSCEESPKPTLEEVGSWGQSFDKLMKSPAGRNAFRDFLRTEFSEENMLFWLACEELKKETNKSVIEEKARLIYEDYISILSPKEVSLDSRVREVINRNMLETTSHTFDDAQLQIYTLMHRDSYPRFMNSSVYKDLLQTLSEPSSES